MELGWNPAVPAAWGPYISFVNWLVVQEEAMQIQCGYVFIEDITRVYTFSPGPEQRIAESVDEPPQSMIRAYLLREMLKPVALLLMSEGTAVGHASCGTWQRLLLPKGLGV